jgi:hypothetical protein
MARFADIKFCVIKPASDPIGMWETSTFTASRHARLNVAPRHVIRPMRMPASAGEKLPFFNVD